MNPGPSLAPDRNRLTELAGALQRHRQAIEHILAEVAASGQPPSLAERGRIEDHIREIARIGPEYKRLAAAQSHAPGDLLAALFGAIDARDTNRFLAFLADDAVFRFGNAPPATGQAAIGTAVEGFFQSIRALEHRLFGHWSDGDALACHGEVTYTRHDGSTVTLPFANTFRLGNDGLIREYLIYADLAPLYSPEA